MLNTIAALTFAVAALNPATATPATTAAATPAATPAETISVAPAGVVPVLAVPQPAPDVAAKLRAFRAEQAQLKKELAESAPLRAYFASTTWLGLGLVAGTAGIVLNLGANKKLTPDVSAVAFVAMATGSSVALVGWLAPVLLTPDTDTKTYRVENLDSEIDAAIAEDIGAP